jgi:tRNA pseudouridine38-40 synthase
VNEDAHCRFDAISREYRYYIYQHKNPFLEERAYYYPYTLNIELLQQAALLLQRVNDFTFSKRNTQVKTFICNIIESKWEIGDDKLVYYVKANRFLRGMVKAMVATQLKVGRGIIVCNSLVVFWKREIIQKLFFLFLQRDCFWKGWL